MRWRGQRGTVDLPSSMFLMRTLRSATSLSTTNCSLSEVTRRTIVVLDGSRGDGDGEEEGKETEQPSGNSVFKGVVSLRKHPPLSHSFHQKINKMTWLGLWRGLQSPTASSPFSVTGRVIGLSPRCHGSRQGTQVWDRLGPPRNAPAARSETTEGHLENG